MIGRFLRRGRAFGNGREAAKRALEMAESQWPYVWSVFPTREAPLTRDSAHCLAYQVFVTDYCWRNILQHEVSEMDRQLVYDGLCFEMGDRRGPMLVSLHHMTEDLLRLWRGNPPFEAYCTALGGWFVDCCALSDPGGNLAPAIGATLITFARKATGTNY